MMEERLKRLRKSMDRGVFRQMPFTEEKKHMIKKGIVHEDYNDQTILIHILQILMKEKTGHELLQHFYARGIKNYEDRQGFLYTTLHKLEQEGLLASSWEEAVKKYRISKKGKKVLHEIQEGKPINKLSFKELLEGD